MIIAARPARPQRTGWLPSAIRGLVGGLGIVAVAGCTTLGEPVVDAGTEGGAAPAFEGVARLATTPGPTAIDILLVHGMCTHDVGWAEAAIGQVAAMLGATTMPAVETLPVPLTSAAVYGAELATPAWNARISAIVWSPMVAAPKAELCEDTTVVPLADCRPRAPRGRAGAATGSGLQGRLIDDCLADAVIYLGRARDQVNDQMQKALVTAARHFEARRGVDTAVARPLVVITQGLGGKLAFDALLRMQQDYSLSHVGNRLADRTTRVYLAANQLPFLKLGDATLANDDPATVPGPAERRRQLQRLGASVAAAAAPAAVAPAAAAPARSMAAGTRPAAAPTRRQAGASVSNPGAAEPPGVPGPDYAPDPVEQFIRNQAAHQRMQRPEQPRLPPLQVVAFNDPHDLMAYGMRPSRRADSPIIDVTLEVEPAALGFVVPPDPAHLNYLRDARVRDLILCGYPRTDCAASQPAAAADRLAPLTGPGPALGPALRPARPPSR